MELLDFRGLNCYSNCIVTVAQQLGVNWTAAFSSLWSETDFKFDPFRKVYLSKRMPGRLARLGAELSMLPCDSPEEAEASLSELERGELFLVGMDAFFLHWVPVFGALHGPHYFIAKDTSGERFSCFDPTYGTQTESISRAEILSHAFDISRIRPQKKIFKCPVVLCIRREAEAVLRTHSLLLEELTERIAAARDEGSEASVLLAKYVDALLSNHYLYRYFLTQCSDGRKAAELFLTEAQFAEWTAVKNGLYKAAVSVSKHSLLEEVQRMISDLTLFELSSAQKIATEYRQIL